MTAPYIPPRPRTLEEALRAAFMPPIAADATATPPVRPDFSGVPMATMRATSAPMPRGPRESGNPAADRLNARVDRGLAMLGRQAAPSADTPEGWLREMFNPVAAGRGTREMANATSAQMRRAGRTGNVSDAAMAAGLGGLTLASAIPGGPADDAARVVAGQSDDVARGIRAYHGTPHRFAPEPDAPLGRFRMDKLGTGEGAQMYGHGLYFADDMEVAKTYAPRNEKYESALMREYQAAERAGDYDALEVFETALLHRTPEQLRSQFTDPGYAKALARVERLNKPGTQGIYEVAIDASPDELLDWDAPVSQQPENVRKALQKFGINSDADPNTMSTLELYGALGGLENTLGAGEAKGAKVYNELTQQLGGRDAASRALHEAGIPGIRYLDGNSRGVGQGTRNYVIWDESKIRILKALAAAGMVSPAALASAEAAYAQQQQERP